VTVQTKPVCSPALAPTRSRRVTPPLPSPAGHRPPRRRDSQAPTLAHPRVRAPLVATPAPPRYARTRGRRLPRDSVGALLLVFVAATLVMVAAVIVVGIVERWWVLVPVMLVDFATTFGVVAYIMRLLADDGEAPRSTPG
jgi:hypothetical protein